MNSTMNEIEYGEIDWEDVFLTMEAEIKQLRKENKKLKQIKTIYYQFHDERIERITRSYTLMPKEQGSR